MSPTSPLNVSLLHPHQSLETSVPIGPVGSANAMEPINLLQIAVKTNIGIYYLESYVPLHILFAQGPGDKNDFNSVWNDVSSLQTVFSVTSSVSDVPSVLNRNGFKVLDSNATVTLQLILGITVCSFYYWI